MRWSLRVQSANGIGSCDHDGALPTFLGGEEFLRSGEFFRSDEARVSFICSTEFEPRRELVLLGLLPEPCSIFMKPSNCLRLFFGDRFPESPSLPLIIQQSRPMSLPRTPKFPEDEEDEEDEEAPIVV